MAKQFVDFVMAKNQAYHVQWFCELYPKASKVKQLDLLQLCASTNNRRHSEQQFDRWKKSRWNIINLMIQKWLL